MYRRSLFFGALLFTLIFVSGVVNAAAPKLRTDTCHSNPIDVIGDIDFKRVHRMVRKQEYVGNIGKTLKGRKDHDTYFNWESKKSFYGRVYNTKYEKSVEGRFSLCKSGKIFLIQMADNSQIPLRLHKKTVQIKVSGITFTLTPYPLRRHGTLKYKLKNANFATKVKQPIPFKFP